MGGAEILAAMRRVDDLEEFLSDRFDDAGRSFELEKLESPILSHAGIIDINKAIDSMEGETTGALDELYKLGGPYPIYALRQGIEQDVLSNYRLSHNIDIYSDRYRSASWEALHRLQNSFYPVIPDGFIGKLANTKLWGRLLGIPQLSWDRDYPLSNEHSRGMHSLFVAVNIARVLQTLYDSDPEKLQRRLRSDFVDEGLIEGDETDEEIIELAALLGPSLGMSHDLYTPDGGDMMKNLVGIDEEAEIERLRTRSQNEFEAEYLAVLGSCGLEDKHVRFLIRCVQGRSRSLIGEMIHSEDGDILEQDRLAYTIQDLIAAGVLDIALPRRFFKDGQIDEDILTERYQKAWMILTDSTTRSLGPISIGKTIPSFTQIDVCDDYILDDTLSLICTRPDKLLWLAALRTMMTVEFYQGAKLRGQEHDFSEILRKRMKQPAFNSLLNDDNLLIGTNADLRDQLLSLKDRELSQFLKEMSSTLYPHSYSSLDVSDASRYDDYDFALPIKIKAGLDTRVLHEGKVISLDEYRGSNPHARASLLIEHIFTQFKGKTRLIRRTA